MKETLFIRYFSLNRSGAPLSTGAFFRLRMRRPRVILVHTMLFTVLPIFTVLLYKWTEKVTWIRHAHWKEREYVRTLKIKTYSLFKAVFTFFFFPYLTKSLTTNTLRTICTNWTLFVWFVCKLYTLYWHHEKIRTWTLWCKCQTLRVHFSCTGEKPIRLGV